MFFQTYNSFNKICKVFTGIYFLDIYRFAGTEKVLKNFYQVIRYYCLILYEKNSNSNQKSKGIKT